MLVIYILWQAYMVCRYSLVCYMHVLASKQQIELECHRQTSLLRQELEPYARSCNTW